MQFCGFSHNTLLAGNILVMLMYLYMRDQNNQTAECTTKKTTLYFMSIRPWHQFTFIVLMGRWCFVRREYNNYIYYSSCNSRPRLIGQDCSTLLWETPPNKRCICLFDLSIDRHIIRSYGNLTDQGGRPASQKCPARVSYKIPAKLTKCCSPQQKREPCAQSLADTTTVIRKFSSLGTCALRKWLIPRTDCTYT